MNDRHLATIISLLNTTASVSAIVDGTGLTRKVIYKALRTLEARRVARICRWNLDKTGRAIEPVWGLGSEPSEPRIKLTAAEKQMRYRKRLRKSRRGSKSPGTIVMQRIVAMANVPPCPGYNVEDTGEVSE